MSTENQEINNSNSSSLTNVDSTGKMKGWFKLIETIRKSGSEPNESIRSLPNSNFNNNFITNKQRNSFEHPLQSTDTNGHSLESSDLITTIHTLDSPPNIFNSPSIISISSTPRQTIEDIPSVEMESTSQLRRESAPSVEIESSVTTRGSSPAPSSDSKSSPKPMKRSTARKSTRSRQLMPIVKPAVMSTPITEDISDDDVPIIDIRAPKKTSIDTLSIPSRKDSIIPLATDLRSLPGHSQDEIRDIRFLAYSDIDTLSMHFETCLYIDQRSVGSSKQYIHKTRYNVLNKILKLYYIKTFRKKLSSEKSSNKNDNHKQQPLSMISSPTSTSFKLDWNVNRRNSLSAHRQRPKNVFHILQLNPKKEFSLFDAPSISTSKSPIQTFERMKDILARTYYPHFYKAIEYGYQFGSKSKFPNTQQLITTHGDIINIKEMPESPDLIDDSITITLKSPPSTTRRDSSIIMQQSVVFNKEQEAKRTKNDNQPLCRKQNQSQLYENFDELSSWSIRKSVVVLTPAKIPLQSQPVTDREKISTVNRKRKSSTTTTTNSNVIDRKRKRIISSQSQEIIDQIEDISDSDSNKYRLGRRRRQSSGSLPPFYTGIFESDNEKSSFVDYHLPYDIYWFAQQQNKEKALEFSSATPTSSSVSVFQHKKKK
ncbi:unnamed protein product [Rotaria magnacalcarata]|uniref:Uncharacterized protein n=1 Tax=Rotaria magnacalcarata TaxID=392030 RepID=A0A816N8M4_9BILA|nr:unnamed protein product [Rotaria magnacalcarata]